MTASTPARPSDLFRAPPTRWVDVGDGEVAVRTVGDGPDVLLVHGWPVTGATWRHLLPHLVRHVRCHVVDLVGAGDSRFDRTVRLGVREHAQGLRRVVDALGLDDLAVVGHDSGGLIARHALVGDPRVRGWGLVDTELASGLGLRFRAFLAAGRLPGLERTLAAALNARRLRRSPLLLGGCFVDPALVDGEFDEFFLRPLRDDPARRWAAAQLLRRFDRSTVTELAALHARIDVPVRLVYGEHDPFFPVDDARRTVSGFGSRAELHVVPGTALFAHEERPHAVAETLLPVLAR